MLKQSNGHPTCINTMACPIPIPMGLNPSEEMVCPMGLNPLEEPNAGNPFEKTGKVIHTIITFAI
jgi:hypothetical protein